MKVTVIDKKTGKEKSMPEKHAKILTALGRADYMTREIQTAPRKAVLTPQTPQVEDLLGEAAPTPSLEEMTLEQLHARAIELGLTLHPQLGVKKTKAAILAAQNAK